MPVSSCVRCLFEFVGVDSEVCQIGAVGVVEGEGAMAGRWKYRSIGGLGVALSGMLISWSIGIDGPGELAARAGFLYYTPHDKPHINTG